MQQEAANDEQPNASVGTEEAQSERLPQNVHNHVYEIAYEQSASTFPPPPEEPSSQAEASQPEDSRAAEEPPRR
jgi:hypothetical protein